MNPKPRVALGLTPYQYGSVALAGVMALLWWRDEKKKKAEAAGIAK